MAVVKENIMVARACVRIWGYGSMVECLPSKCKALDLISAPEKKKIQVHFLFSYWSCLVRFGVGQLAGKVRKSSELQRLLGKLGAMF